MPSAAVQLSYLTLIKQTDYNSLALVPLQGIKPAVATQRYKVCAYNVVTVY